MAAQQAQIADTIRAMKIALKRRVDDDSDVDDDHYPAYSNRGTKLSRSARFARYDQLDTTGGLAYRKRANHAGYNRAILSRNPPLYDSEGELVSPYSSDAEERTAEPLRENPFADIHLDTLLKPLTAVDALTTHPSLALPFQSAGLTQLVNEAATMLRVQKDALWRAKRLLKRLEGDADWAPSALFETEADSLLLNRLDDNSAPSLTDTQDQQTSTDEPDRQWDTNGKLNDTGATNGVQQQQQQQQQDDHVVAEETTEQKPQTEPEQEIVTKPDTDMADADADASGQRPSEQPQDTATDRQASAEPPASDAASLSTTAIMHSMTTRARARSPRASASPSPSPSDSASVPNISPWFLAPLRTIPDRDLGLPADEAESTRKLLLIYCQKQEQIIRSLELLYAGLQRGDRLRKHIFDSAKASAHLVPDAKGNMVTAMADGEDWYDEEEYGILEKGKDEAEDVEDENRRGGRRRRVVGRVNG